MNLYNRLFIRKNNIICLMKRRIYGEKLTFMPSYPFITGMGYRKLCNFCYDEFSNLNVDDMQQFDGMNIFVKPEFLGNFRKILPDISKKFYLFSHNSDVPITSDYADIADNDNLVFWHSSNISFRHKKLGSVPLGLANQIYVHGNPKIMKRVIAKKHKKENMVHCAIDVVTNRGERSYCLEQIAPYKSGPRLPYGKYLTQLAKSYFTISPEGNGVDCHRTWEALYLRTVPIVTKSINIDFYRDYPMLVLDDWKDFKDLELTPQLYESLWKNFDYNRLYLHRNSYDMMTEQQRE